MFCCVLLAPASAWAAECVWGNCQDGHGTLRHADGRMERGIWQNGRLVELIREFAPAPPQGRATTRESAPSDRAAAPERRPPGCVQGHCRNGTGTRTYADGSTYEGEFLSGLRHGNGVQRWPDGRRYEGRWAADRRHGYGVQTYSDGQYRGSWLKGDPTEKGLRSWRNGNRYVGEYRREVPHGRGRLSFADGSRYVGNFRQGEMHGEGSWLSDDGRRQSGRWSGGEYLGAGNRATDAIPGLVAGGTGCVAGDCWNGKGRYVYADGREYLGRFERGKPHGRGSMTLADGRVDSGTWESGKRVGRRVIADLGAVATWKKKNARSGCRSGSCQNGTGSYLWRDGSTYTGEFVDSRPHGRGTWTHPNGERYTGGWLRGNRHGQGIATSASGLARAGNWVEGRLQAARFVQDGTRSVRLPWPDLLRPAPRVAGGDQDAAIVVGIERYAHLARIPGADENATAWYQYLVRTLGVPVGHTTLLLGNDATLEDIQWALAQAADQVGESGTLWFVFIGHGAPARDRKDGLLVGFDAQQKARSVEMRSLRRSDLLADLEQTRASRIRIFLDACFSGKTGNGEQLVAGLQPLVVTAAADSVDPRTTLFTAARNDEVAGPLPGASRPAFSYLALGGLRGWADGDGNGAVTAAELQGYVDRTLRALARDRRQRTTLLGPKEALVAGGVPEEGPRLSSLVRGLAKSQGAASLR